MQSKQEDNTIDQLIKISFFYERCRIPLLIKFLDLLSYCGIKLSYQSQMKENQIVALSFFLQNLKGITHLMTYRDLLKHFKASTHDYSEFKSNTHLFELICNFKCETKETFKAIYVSNQLLMDCDGEGDLSLVDFAAKIEELFSTEDENNGVITLEFLITELKNIQNELKGFFFFFNKYIQGAKANVGLLTSKLIDNPLTKRLWEYKGLAYKTYERINPIKALVAYYSHIVEVYQISEKYSNAKKYISNGVAVPIDWTNRIIIQPLDNMKVVVLEKVVKLKTDLSSASESSRNKVIELSNQVIEKIKDQYGDMSAWLSIKGSEINVVVKKRFASLNQQWLLEYINRIKEINCYETISSYYQQWLNKPNETHEDRKDNENHNNSVQKQIELELTYSIIPNEPAELTLTKD